MDEDNKNPEEPEQEAMTGRDPEQAQEPAVVPKQKPAKTSTGRFSFKRFTRYYKSHKKLAIPVTVLALLAVVLAVPYTRYLTLGNFVKQNVTVQVTDSKSGKPVAGALVSLRGINALTNANGDAVLHVKLGRGRATITKKYYKDNSDLVVTADVIHAKKYSSYNATLVAVGRQVPIEFHNKISGTALEGVRIKAAGTEAVTDKEGKSIIVLPADENEVDATVAKSGYNDQSVKITITEKSDDKNSFQLTPVGKVYFLSKQSGKIDLVKTNLDGSARQAVLPGTGTEDDGGTVLLASRDWKYLALFSRRDGTSKPAKLYLIEAGTDKVSNMDEGDVTFSLLGWADHKFVYRVDRNNLKPWDAKLSALKYFDAEKKSLTTVDEVGGAGSDIAYTTETFGWQILAGNDLVYYKNWVNAGNGRPFLGGLDGKSNKLIKASLATDQKQTVKEFNLNDPNPVYDYYYSPLASYQAVLYEPSSILFKVENEDKGGGYFQYEDGQFKANSQDAKDYFSSYKPYPTYLASPSGNKTLWSDSRDGKNVLFIGDESGKNEHEIASLTEYDVYGWYSDDYILVSKKGSELYILPKDGLKSGVSPLKITDYHKPAQRFFGYGGGYGGF